MTPTRRWHGGLRERSADQAHPVRPTNYWSNMAAWRWARRHSVAARITIRDWVQ